MQKRNTKQHVLPLYLLLLPVFIINLHSCEFDSDNDNFVFLEKPEEEIQIGIELAGINPAELIYVYNNTQFSYSLFTGGKNIFVRQFFLDGQPLYTDEHTGIGYLETDITDNEIHELKLVIGLNTGTGSLAEYAGYEMYTGEFNFKIKIIPFSDELNIRETRSLNNNLKLEWDKPKDYEVWGYEVYKGDIHFGELLTRIINPDETFFIDTDYAYGYKHYTVAAYVKNSFGITVVDNITVNYSNITDKNFEMYRTSLDELFIKWNNPNPFPCKYVLEYGYNEKVIIEEGLNEVTIQAERFPSRSQSFTLYIIPKSANIDQYDSYSSIHGGYSDKQLSAISFKEDTVNNILYGLTFTSFDGYEMPSMKKISSVNHNLVPYSRCQVQATKDGRVAINDTEDFVHIYSDHSLKNKITMLKADDYSYSFYFAGNNSLLIEERSGFKIYDITTNAILCSKTWQSEKTYGEIVTQTSISRDGKYIYVKCTEYHSSDPDEWIELYEIDTDHTLKLLETAKIKDIKSIYFHPIKNTEVVIQYLPHKQNKFVIMDILTKDQKEIKGEFMNIDPFNGNLLFRGEEYQGSEPNLYVYDKSYSKEIMKIELAFANIWAASYLSNSLLFFDGHYLNLSNLKEWKQ